MKPFLKNYIKHATQVMVSIEFNKSNILIFFAKYIIKKFEKGGEGGGIKWFTKFLRTVFFSFPSGMAFP